MINKDDVLAILNEALAKVSALEDVSSPDVAELQKKIDDLSQELALVKAELDEKKALLASIDAMAKAMDAAIPDA